MKTIWKNFAFTRFFASFTIGNIGDWFDVFALQIIFIHEWHASPIFMGILILFFFLPSILLSPFAGVWADRVNKRNLMLNTDVIAACLTLGLYVSHSLFEALILLLIRSSVVCFNNPAQQAYVKLVVSDRQLLKASGYMTIVFQMCKVFGPMLGALVLLYASARDCLLINAFSFVVSALVLTTLPKDEIMKEKQEKTQNHWANDLATGAQFIWNHSLLRIVMLVVIIWFFCSMVRQAQLAIYLQQVLPHQKNALGLFMGFEGLGAVASSLLLSRKNEILYYGAYFFLGVLLLSTGIFGLGMYHNPWPAGVLYTAAVIIGLGTGILLVTYGYLIKKEAPKTEMGRISGTSSALQNLALAIGTLSSGFFVLQWGVQEVYLVLSVFMFILALYSFIGLSPQTMKIKR